MVLTRQMEQMTGKSGTYRFVTNSLPDRAGIDPLLLLVDHIPDDNLKKVSVVQYVAGAVGRRT